ncbi:MAG: YbaB/EbfC family nucleoid-associated protein [Chthonomonas sp.]|nr:YbaB/EbfC family nucleoid-associated protein [Chthonomonas sp.]
MKLPKNLGFGMPNMGDMMKQAQDAVERAKHLETELEGERLTVDKGPVKVTMDGRGALVGIKLDASIVDPEAIEDLEDLITAAAKDGFERATAIRQDRMNEIMPNLPNIPGITG